MLTAVAGSGASTVTKDAPTQPDRPDRIVREAEARAISGLSRTTRWRLARAGKFPGAIQIGCRAVGWSLRDIEAWLAECRAAR